MTLRPAQWVIIALILLSFGAGMLLYDDVPERFASHWDAQGNVNGYMSRFWGMFFMPILAVVMFGIFSFLPAIDPMSGNIRKFLRQFDIFMVMVFVFFFYIYALTLLWNLGYRFELVRLLAPAIAVLLFYTGWMLRSAKRNWFIGIRTPWTMSSEKVWDETHRLGSKLFMVSGLIALLGMLDSRYAFLLMIGPILASTLILFLYSYIAFRRQKKRR